MVEPSDFLNTKETTWEIGDRSIPLVKPSNPVKWKHLGEVGLGTFLAWFFTAASSGIASIFESVTIPFTGISGWVGSVWSAFSGGLEDVGFTAALTTLSKLSSQLPDFVVLPAAGVVLFATYWGITKISDGVS